MKSALFPIFILFLVGLPTLVGAAGWHIIPIRLDFNQRARSGVITLFNDSDQPISFTLEASSWSQDEAGKDQYSATSDLIFFPKELTINPKEERVIRAGIKALPVNQEKTYRLFIKEQPPKNDNSANSVAIAIRFGVPIFVEPPRVNIQGEIAQTELRQGKLDITLHNQGNHHFRIKTINVTGENAKGEKVFSQELNGWYLLAGTVRTYSVLLPDGTCQELKTLEIQASGDKLQINGKVNVDPTMCLAQ